jgi:hypothetical protein
MYRVPPARAWWPAVAAPVERGVRPGPRVAGRPCQGSVLGSVLGRNPNRRFGDGAFVAQGAWAQRRPAFVLKLPGIARHSEPNLPTFVSCHAVRALNSCSGASQRHRLSRSGGLQLTHGSFSLSVGRVQARGGGRREAEVRGFAATRLFNSRRQALTLFAYCKAAFAGPNVRAKLPA